MSIFIAKKIYGGYGSGICILIKITNATAAALFSPLLVVFCFSSLYSARVGVPQKRARRR